MNSTAASANGGERLPVAPVLQPVDPFPQIAPLRVELRIYVRIAPDKRAAQRVLTFEYEALAATVPAA